jgi:MATE family multidrug resistance protein
MQGVINGIVTGLGIIKKVRFTAMITYWLFGIPLSYYCMFKLEMGIEGLWFGPSLAVLLNYCVYEFAIS